MRRWTLPIAVALGLFASVAGCASSDDGSASATSAASVATFTCCERSDIDTVRHPGETFEVHWIMDRTPTSETVPTAQIVLNLSLSRQYQTVEELKSAETKAPTVLVKAPSVSTSSTATVAPVSVVTIPNTATPGFYNLTASVDSDGAVLIGSSVIRVEAP